MKKPKIKPDMIDNDNPEWTADDFARARPARDVLPEILGPKVAADLLKRRPGQRGPQKAPLKVPVNVRLSPEVLAKFKATGPGWQNRMEDALKDWLAKRRE